MLTPFRNEPESDFGDPENVAAFQDALIQVKNDMGKPYPLIIGGDEVMTVDTLTSMLPAEPHQVFATVAQATSDHAIDAIEVACNTFEDWRRVSPHSRVCYLLKAAQRIRQRKHHFSATLVYEVGKSWDEADREVSEAIDYLEYYARQMIEFAGSARTIAPQGEETEMYYTPLGMGLIISPWNFPMSLAVGMLAAAIVAGNTVVIKPSNAACVSTSMIVDVFHEVNLPPGVINFLPGRATAIDEVLVDHPQTRFVAFVGSKEVGLAVHQRAAMQQPGQMWIKRTMLLMGGKNAIIVDETANLDAAADGIVISAFSFQGQKGSACSRAILLDSVYDAVVERIVAKTRALRVGPTDNQLNWIGPVINEQAYRRVLSYIDCGRAEGKLLLENKPSSTTGYFIAPTIFGDVDPQATIAQEEIFGPVLACTRARDFENALEMANGTPYALTGALYSEDRERLEQARRDFLVGNLYCNRPCTGAIVGAHPYGGFHMSGTGAKMGGPDYLLLFLQGKTVGERL